MDFLLRGEVYLCDGQPVVDQWAALRTMYCGEGAQSVSAGFTRYFHLETRILTLALNEHPSRSVLLIYLGIDDVPRKIFSFKYLRRLDFAL